MKALKWYRA